METAAPPDETRRAAINPKTDEPSKFTMKVSDKTLAFDKNLWVQFEGVRVKEAGGEIKLTARDDEAYLKVFNHFGRVLKLFIFEDGKWVDSDTGLAAKPFDESQAGHLPDAPPGTKTKKPVKKTTVKTTVKTKAAKKPAADKKTKAAEQKATAKTTAKKAKTPPAAGKKASGKAKTPKS